MNVLNTIPKIEGANYFGINLSVCIGVDGGHIVVEFDNEGGGYYPVLIADEKSRVPISCEELKELTKWIEATCTELDRIEAEYKNESSTKN